jgi:pectate lyase
MLGFAVKNKETKMKFSFKKVMLPVIAASALLFGSASQAADTGGFATTTGGDSYTAVTVTTLAQLTAAFNAGDHHITVSGNIYGGSTLTTLTFATTSWNNTTIDGASGGGAVLQSRSPT